MKQCKAIVKSGARCKRTQQGDYCYQHSFLKSSPKTGTNSQKLKPVAKPTAFQYSFDQKPSGKRIRELRKFLLDLPWEEFQICWTRGNDVVLAKPIRGLQQCKNPDRFTFLNQVEEKRGGVGHLRSLTGRSRLVIPLKPYAHLGCFLREGTFQEFQDMIKMVHGIVGRSPPRMHLSVFTHGLDVDWLHVKIRPDPL